MNMFDLINCADFNVLQLLMVTKINIYYIVVQSGKKQTFMFFWINFS